MNNAIFWVEIHCNSVEIYRYFGGMLSPPSSDQTVSEQRNHQNAGAKLIKERRCFYQTVRSNSPHHSVHNYRCEDPQLEYN
jgi:hypothetical protein